MAEAFPSISMVLPKLRERDEPTWNQLIPKFQPGLSAKARFLLRDSSLQRRLDSEELVNICLTKAWQNCHQFRGDTTAQFASWMLRILHTTFINHCRPKTLDYTVSSWGLHTAESESPSQRLMLEEEEVRLHACLAELDPIHREVIILRHLEQMKFQEIATKLDTTTGTIAGRHRQALKLLTDRMDDLGRSGA